MARKNFKDGLSALLERPTPSKEPEQATAPVKEGTWLMKAFYLPKDLVLKVKAIAAFELENTYDVVNDALSKENQEYESIHGSPPSIPHNHS